MQTSQSSDALASPPSWGDFSAIQHGHAYLQSLNTKLGLCDVMDGSVLEALHQLQHKVPQGSALKPQFVCQSQFEHDQRYYESIIAEEYQVPTRLASWHDFFNGVIWHLFPQTKRLLNRLHVSEINQHGSHPRTALRNRITHFDECGLVLVGLTVEARDVIQALTEHHWQSALWDQRALWHSAIIPIVFGHANLEMLLKPFPQLTAKWLYIEMQDYTVNDWQHGDVSKVDQQLSGQLSTILQHRQRLKPLPLAGIPGWEQQQTARFYQNKSVFRDKRQ